MDLVAWFGEASDALVESLNRYPLAALAGLAVIPIIGALSGRSPSAIAATLILLTLAAFGLAATVTGRGDPLFPIGAYGGAVLVALSSAAERRLLRRGEALEDDIEMMRAEVRSFLVALDRRARTVDTARREVMDPD